MNMSYFYVRGRRIGLNARADNWYRKELMFELCHGRPLPNKDMFNKQPNHWVRGMFPLWTIFVHNEIPTAAGPMLSDALRARRHFQHVFQTLAF
jgi:hypothetical protein